MRLTGILTTGMVSAIIPLYIISHGLRASIPLFIALVAAIFMGMVAE